MAETGGVVIHVSPVLSSLQDELSDTRLTMPPTYCIFQTPSILLRHRKTAFLPTCFSIGPIHHGDEKFFVTEKIKFKYLKGMLSRVANSKMMTEDTLLNECVDAVEGIEKKASSYYAGRDFSAKLGDNFQKILLLDGCFIIELFRKEAEVCTKEEDDPIFTMSCMLQFLHHDLILLENQIPWLVLQTLFDKTKLPSDTKPLIDLALLFFKNLFVSHSKTGTEPFNTQGKEIKHILDLIRLSLVLPYDQKIHNKPKITKWQHLIHFITRSKAIIRECLGLPPAQEIHEKIEWQPIHSTTRLKEAGVKFKKASHPASVLDIKFTGGIGSGTLEIPSLLIQETTETIFRNLIAYEQCLPTCSPIFTCYAKLLDNLIDTTSDIEILTKKDIFDNWLSPEDATQFFNKLCNDTFVKEFYYSKLCDDLNRYCKRRWPRWRAAYVQNYFAKPWAIAAQIYAIIMFALAFWQTFLKK